MFLAKISAVVIIAAAATVPAHSADDVTLTCDARFDGGAPHLQSEMPIWVTIREDGLVSDEPRLNGIHLIEETETEYRYSLLDLDQDGERGYGIYSTATISRLTGDLRAVYYSTPWKAYEGDLEEPIVLTLAGRDFTFVSSVEAACEVAAQLF